MNAYFYIKQVKQVKLTEDTSKIKSEALEKCESWVNFN
jgi:hypothetical protein